MRMDLDEGTLLIEQTWPGHVSVVKYLSEVRSYKSDSGLTRLADAIVGTGT